MKQKVAAYARVSMQSESLEHSLEAQVDYYTDLIEKNPLWTLAGVYADNGISGTQMRNRDQLLMLLDKCEAGEVDLILTKSISRFARNTVELLEIIRHLKELDVAVYFEKENINTMSDEGEVMLSLLASFAQEESRSISENIRWGYQKAFEAGKYRKNPVYGYKWVGDQAVIVPEEAEVVKSIYADYLNGISKPSTLKRLKEEGRLTRTGKFFSYTSLCIILRNPIYTGDIIMQKSYRQDHISHKRHMNRGELPMYVIRNAHEAIIPREEFDRVQEGIAYRNENHINYPRFSPFSCFARKLICGSCGGVYTRQIQNGKETQHIRWYCDNRRKKVNGKPICSVKRIREEVLKDACCKALNMEQFDEKIFNDKVRFITVMPDHSLVFHLQNQQTIEIKGGSQNDSHNQDSCNP